MGLVLKPVPTEKLVRLVKNCLCPAFAVCYWLVVDRGSKYRRAILSFISATLVLERNI